jgi:23S rRNA (uridine2552-2'-O)-methyltransferase
MARRRLHDAYFKRAKAEGFAARSAYKLLEINEKRRLLRRADRVLDLGCAPGSWLQAAAEIVGPRGMVVGVDVQPVGLSIGPNVKTVAADITQIDSAALVSLLGEGQAYDAVLSDMAPNTTGAGDHFRSVALCRAVLERLPGVLRPGGSLVMKVFEGETYPALLAETGRLFERCKGFKPKASRDVSCEIYIIGEGYRGPGPEAG